MKIFVCCFRHSVVYSTLIRGRHSSVGIVTELRAGQSGHQILVATTFSTPIQTSPGTQPASYTMGTGSVSRCKVDEAWHWPPTPSSAEVKERVELYLYSPSGTLWPILVWTLPFILHFDQYCFSPRDYFIKNYSCIKYTSHASIWLHKIIIDAVHLCTAWGGHRLSSPCLCHEGI